MHPEFNIQRLNCDVLIIGGGAAGCAAAHKLSEGDYQIILCDKAPIVRSGCLAAGVNAINACLAPGYSPQDYADYAKRDAHGIASERLLLSMSQGLNEATLFLEKLGLKIHKGPDGSYKYRSWRNLIVNGENIKPLLALPLKDKEGLTILERVLVISYLVTYGDRRVSGAAALSIDSPTLYFIEAKAVICATGGAAGIYLPNNPGYSGHKMWYPPFNTGAGYAMGILAGAEMTTLEMRFVALRAADTAAPTGTLAVGANAKQLNILGQAYEAKYGNTTSQRVLAARKEQEEGRGPCRLITESISLKEKMNLVRAYLHMAPLQSLKFIEEMVKDELWGSNLSPSPLQVTVEASEPFVLGGHTAGGYQVDESRKTTLKGLFAAGDVAGGAPQKYVSGAISEGFLAAQGVKVFLEENLEKFQTDASLEKKIVKLLSTFRANEAPGFSTQGLEEAMQKTMDSLAGGARAGYAYNDHSLRLAEEGILELYGLSGKLPAPNIRDLMYIWELRERMIVARSLIRHMAARRETRWPGFGEYKGYPLKQKDYELFINSRLLLAPVIPPLEGSWGEIEIIKRDLVTGEIIEEKGAHEHSY
ncbi:MAG: adenylyl-sulfate reductase subunit alpha [Deltaproteobacteria bacterium]|jgi:adenylylsulfate reductase subunit A|nr:adenylyl-sulfate reductase subunit alpha [Deltaproteobacteria bacterium]